jgi:hypothetical protein
MSAYADETIAAQVCLPCVGYAHAVVLVMTVHDPFLVQS